MSTVYIGLGSNLGDRLGFLRRAHQALSHKINMRAVSPVYETQPVGLLDQPLFLNAVCVGDTSLSPQEILSVCLDIEQQLGRTRTLRNGPRTIDLDILFYDQIMSDNHALTLPHPRIHERAFVLAPLSDIAPDFIHPILGVSIQDLLEKCGGKEHLVHRGNEVI